MPCSKLSVPAKSSWGRLRLTRTGNQLHCFVDDGGATQFRELTKFPFGDSAVTWINVAAHNGGSGTLIDAHWTEVSIHATDSLGAHQARPSRSWAWLWWTLFALLTVAIVGTAWLRKSKRTW